MRHSNEATLLNRTVDLRVESMGAVDMHGLVATPAHPRQRALALQERHVTRHGACSNIGPFTQPTLDE